MKAFLIASLLYVSSIEAQTITTLPLTQEAVCPRDSVDVRFEASGSFGSNNIFQVQVSNVLGTFTSFNVLGSWKGSSSGVVRVVIPDDISESDKYRFRVISTSPYVEGTASTEVFIPRQASYHTSSSRYVGLVMDTFVLEASKNHSTLTGPYDYVWDLGEGAVPKTAIGNPTKAVYQTPGRKIAMVSVNFGTGCTMELGVAVDVGDCFPTIPSNSRIIDLDTSYGASTGNVWVWAGASYQIGDRDTVFAESGANIHGSGGGYNVIYLKPGAQYSGSDQAFRVHAEGAIGGSGYRQVKCPDLEFDYSDAPSPDDFASVSKELPHYSIERVANRIEIRTDAIIRDIQVFDVLGRVVHQQNDGSAIELGNWTTGKYFIRVNFGNAVITRSFDMR